jgi:hypothetical protein
MRRHIRNALLIAALLAIPAAAYAYSALTCDPTPDCPCG